ncbi:hypothetical protein ACFY12_33850 [Streptomyces sp. NPDC001339]|uniref:hypothetical protein n=1 Tax=Streptomyces sp. NPDC001339 TaxID=3364563 RepID=UPI003695D388
MHPFQRVSLPSPAQPSRLPAPSAWRPAHEQTPIFDQLLKEWRAGELRPPAHPGR